MTNNEMIRKLEATEGTFVMYTKNGQARNVNAELLTVGKKKFYSVREMANYLLNNSYMSSTAAYIKGFVK